MTNQSCNTNEFKKYAYFDAFILLQHWLWSLAFLTSFGSGLRIAADHRQWVLEYFNAFAQTGQVYMIHLLSAIFISFSLLAYIAYLIHQHKLNHLWPLRKDTHNRLDSLRAMHLLGVTLLSLIALSGVCLLLESVRLNDTLNRDIHFYISFSLCVFIVVHIALIVMHGGMKLILSIFILKRIALVRSMYVVVSIIILLAVSAYLLSSEKVNYEVIKTRQGFVIDGRSDEPAWMDIQKIQIKNKLGNHQSNDLAIQFQAAQDKQNIYFLISWPDPDKSLSHTPLIKIGDDWRVLKHGFEKDDETLWYEDKLAIMIADEPFAAIRSIFLGSKPLMGAPASRSGRGYHFTTNSRLVDLWHWKAWRTDSLFQAEDGFVSSPRAALPWQPRYEAGLGKDPKLSGGYTFNWKWFNEGAITPKRIPRSSRFIYAGSDDPKPQTLSPVPGMRWDDTVTYQMHSDRVPEKSIMPSTMTKSAIEGDQGDVRAKGIWEDGRWTLELSRLKETDSEFDIAFRDTVYIWLSVFNHAQTRHSYHLRPIALKLQ